MSNIVQFNPVKVIKSFWSLRRGDILVMNSQTGRYVFSKTTENVGNDTYRQEAYSISFAPHVIEQYKDYFVTLDEQGNEIVDPQEINDEITKLRSKIAELEGKLIKE